MTPLDEIELMKGKPVLIIQRDGKEVEGTLNSFDLNAHVGIQVKGEPRFISGYSVSLISCLDDDEKITTN